MSNDEYNPYSDYVLMSQKDEYVIYNKLGCGAFGQVVKCLMKKSHKFVAVKIYNNKPRDIQDAEYEIRMLKTILTDTPDKFNFVKLFDCFAYENHTCIAFELLEMNLKDFIVDHIYPARAVGYILHQLLTGLVRLKELGIVHTDIKPANIMLVDTKRLPYQVKLIDFGSAVKINDIVQGDYITTRYYRSPEVILGSPYTEKTDMWSLGCVAAELLIKDILYPGISEDDQIRKICEMQTLPPLSMLENSLKAARFFRRTAGGGIQFKASEEDIDEKIPIKISYLEDITLFNTSHLKGETWREEIFNRSRITNLIRKMLQIDPKKRITPEEGLSHAAVCDKF